jgi:hypothetical protein
MAKRPNPTISGTSVNMPPPVDGVDNLPLPSGVNEGLKEKNNDMPEVNMSKNDGGNPPAVQAPFANGKDMRSKGPSPTSSPFPAMPGAAS